MAENLNLKTIDTVDTRPFKKLVMTIGELPTSFVESMTYYELLAWLVNYLETVIIPTVNNNGEVVKELQDLFVQLKKFVDEYFDNLDVQDEIDNKLDEMVEDGTLARIINEELLNQLSNQVSTNTINISKLPLKTTPTINRLGRFIEPYGTDIRDDDTALTNYNLQGSCLTSDSTMIMVYINNDDTSATIKEFNFENGQILREVTVNWAGHGNGLCKIGDYLYVACYDGLVGTTVKKVNYSTLELVDTYTFDFPVKTIYQDEVTNKIYLGNDFNVHEWNEIDTTNNTWLFDWNIPNFQINVDGTIQTFAIYNNMIYLLGCKNNSNNIVVFVLDIEGNLYTSWDLGDNNRMSYYGEGQDIMNIGEKFYMTSTFRLGSGIYNDYIINNVYEFNPFVQIPKDGYQTLLTPSSLRQVNANNNSFFAKGTTTYPYKFYFEVLLENRLNNQNNPLVIRGGNQPRMILREEKAQVSCSNVIIEGIQLTRNSELYFVGNNSTTINSKRVPWHAEIQIISNSSLYIQDTTIGDVSNNRNDYSVSCEEGGYIDYNNMTFTHAVPIWNISGSVRKCSNINKLDVANQSLIDTQTIVVRPVEASSANNYVAEISVNDHVHSILTSANRKYMLWLIRLGTNEFTMPSLGQQSLASYTQTRDCIYMYNNQIYYANITVSYDNTNKKFVFKVNSATKSDGTSANLSTLGYVTVSLIMML